MRRKLFVQSTAPVVFTPTVAVGGLGLQTSSTAFWQFQDTNWTDELGLNDLTGNGSPTTAVGVVGNCADLTAATTYLSHATATALVVGGGTFSFSLWVNKSGVGGATGKNMLSKDDGGFGHHEFHIGTRFSGSNKYTWSFWDSSSVEAVCDGSATGTGWHHLVATWDGTTQKLYVDNGTATTNTPGITPNASDSTFMIGRGAKEGTYAAALIDQVGIWKGRVLSSTDVSLLYNGGAGLSWAAMA